MKQGWEIKKLGEVCENVSNINWKKISVDTEYPYIDLSAVDRDSSNICDYEYVNKDNAPSRAKQVVNTGDVIFATTRPLLKRVCVITELFNNAIASTGFCVLRPTEKVISKWIYYKLKSDSFYKYIEPLQKGISYPAVSDNEVKNFILPIPPLAEQERIVAELDCLSGVIEKKKQQLKELDALAQSIFYQMFGDPISNEKGWKIDRLGNMCDISSSKRIYAHEYCEDGIPFYRGKEITEKSKGNDISVELYIAEDRYNELKHKYGVPQIGDILITAVGTIGNIWVVDNDTPFYFKDGNVLWLQIKDNINPIYFKTLLYNLIDKYKESMANGCAYSALTIVNLKEMQTNKIPLALQQQFAEKIEAIEKQRELIKESIKETETLFNARMDYYFN